MEEQKLPNQLEKNIQLSEKVEFLSTMGALSTGISDAGETIIYFIPSFVLPKVVNFFKTAGRGQIIKSEPNQRMIDFVNSILEISNGESNMYCFMQKYLLNRLEFKKEMLIS